eukprot:336240-Pelagomonas_calceolata.AAC.5
MKLARSLLMRCGAGPAPPALEQLAWRALSYTYKHACVNKAWSAAGRSCCCPRHCMSMPPLCLEGLALPTFQCRLRCFPRLSASQLFNFLACMQKMRNAAP